MNAVGKINIALNIIIDHYPGPSSAAERDVNEKSDNITLFKLVGTLAFLAGLAGTRYLSVWLASVLQVDASNITAVMFAIYFAGLWYFLLRRWNKSQQFIPDMPADRRAALEAFDEFKLHAKKGLPGIYNECLAVRKTMVRVLASNDPLAVQQLVSSLIVLSKSRELQELCMGKEGAVPLAQKLERALTQALGDHGLHPIEGLSEYCAMAGIFNPATV